MDPNLILQTLECSLKGNNESIRKAEEIFQNARSQEGLAKALMIIANSTEVKALH